MGKADWLITICFLWVWVGLLLAMMALYSDENITTTDRLRVIVHVVALWPFALILLALDRTNHERD